MRFQNAALAPRFMHGWGRAFCFVLCYSALSANAQWLPGHDYVLDRAGNVIHVRGPSITTPSYVVTGSNSGAIVRSTKEFVVDNRKVAIQAVKTIPWKNVATGVAKVARLSPYSMAAGFAVDWLIDNGWRYQDCLNNASTCDGQIQWQRKASDTEIAQTPGSGAWGWSGVNAGAGYGSPSAACSAWAVSIGQAMTSINQLSATQFQCLATHVGSLGVVSKSIACPGGVSPDSSGKCTIPGIDQWVDSPPPDFDADPPNPPDPDKAPDIWGEALPGGIPDSSGSPSVTGPSSSPGPSSTSSGPSGTSTTTTVNNYTYQGDTITITQSTVTTTTSPTGETTTEETVSDKAPDKEEVDPCKQNPDSLGCIKLGEVPDEQVTKLTREVSVTAEAVNLPAQCPAPIEAAGYSLSFDAACDFSEGVHPFVLAAAALMAGLIVIRSIQGA